MGSTASEQHTDSLSVSWTDNVRFVRQLSHDLRNHLNAAELQAVYISELTGDAELKTEIKRLRTTIDSSLRFVNPKRDSNYPRKTGGANRFEKSAKAIMVLD